MPQAQAWRTEMSAFFYRPTSDEQALADIDEFVDELWYEHGRHGWHASR